jgi:DNA-binding NarL/FixJ family response regulator
LADAPETWAKVQSTTSTWFEAEVPQVPSDKRQRQLKSADSSTKESAPPSVRRIFIVEDHPIFREGLAHMVNSEEDLAVCGEAGDAEHALPEILRLKPNLVLVDISLPGRSGLELVKELRSRNGGLKLLVISMHDEALYADRVLRAGGDGYIMKQEDPEEIIHAIRDILDGHIYVSEEVLAGRPKVAPKRRAEPEMRRIEQLTDSELETLELLGRGRSNQEIARQLGLSATSVLAHYRRIQRKLKLRHANELLRYAVCWVENG